MGKRDNWKSEDAFFSSKYRGQSNCFPFRNSWIQTNVERNKQEWKTWHIFVLLSHVKTHVGLHCIRKSSSKYRQVKRNIISKQVLWENSLQKPLRTSRTPKLFLHDLRRSGQCSRNTRYEVETSIANKWGCVNRAWLVVQRWLSQMLIRLSEMPRTSRLNFTKLCNLRKFSHFLASGSSLKKSVPPTMVTRFFPFSQRSKSKFPNWLQQQTGTLGVGKG